MNIEELREYCISQKSVSEELPFGPDTLVFKVAGKVFLLVGLDQVDQLCFNVKCDPQYAVELREKYEQTVLPGYHMNKKHWNTVFANRELSDDTLFELIDHSYQLVFQSLPKKIKEEIDPAAI
ncbi:MULTISPECIES: MmcQ/YjbR family DNA-binding protein [Sphingobacterium]|uniref:MmcQ/YjbR family DNA-binding protein n=1 Tax=Sphingobacterium TaxID=28453 RepID=UPI0013DA9661|nr:MULTISPECIES: MmcQ/YjbR family DNA-binding protein [unclassified Sphingobacterium]